MDQIIRLTNRPSSRYVIQTPLLIGGFTQSKLAASSSRFDLCRLELWIELLTVVRGEGEGEGPLLEVETGGRRDDDDDDDAALLCSPPAVLFLRSLGVLDGVLADMVRKGTAQCLTQLNIY